MSAADAPTARPAEAARHLKALSRAGFVLMVAGLLGLLATQALFSPNPIVIAAQIAAVALMVWARVTFGRRSFHATADPTAGGLVTTGPYHYIRHPIYTAVCLFALAGASGHPSLTAIGLCAVVLLGAVARLLSEERLLCASYPDYADYMRHTKRMVPGLF